MPDNPTPDLDRLLRIAAAELPPDHFLVIRAGGDSVDVYVTEHGFHGDHHDTSHLATVAERVAYVLKAEGILLEEVDPPPPDDRPPIDYRDLLEKYILHIIDQEGTDFLFPGHRTDRFSDEEWAELRRLSESGDEED